MSIINTIKGWFSTPPPPLPAPRPKGWQSRIISENGRLTPYGRKLQEEAQGRMAGDQKPSEDDIALAVANQWALPVLGDGDQVPVVMLSRDLGQVVYPQQKNNYKGLEFLP